MLYIFAVIIFIVLKCFDCSIIDLAITYFKDNHVRFVCLLTCETHYWNLVFAKKASIHLLMLSQVDIHIINDGQTNKLDLCLRQQTPLGVFVDQKCQEFENIMVYASKNMLLDSKHKWLIVDEKTDTTPNDDDLMTEQYDMTESNETQVYLHNGTSLTTTLDRLNISVDADITVAIFSRPAAYNIYEIFNYGKQRGGAMIIKHIGEVNASTDLNMNNDFKYYKRWNFNNLTMKMIAVMTSSLTFDSKMILNGHAGVAVITQAGSLILELVAEAHNFSYAYSICDRWIGDMKRSSPYAVINGLYFRDHDVTPIIRWLPTYFDKFDIIFPPVTQIETRYYYRIPSFGTGKFENQFLTPLSVDTWWCVVAVSVLCGIVLLLASFLEDRPYSFHYAFFSVLALFCQQFFEDSDEQGVRRTSTARKLTILVTGLSCVLIYNYYTSSVVSWLLNGPPPSINSLWELMDSPLQPIFEDIGYSRSWLQLPDYYYNKRNARAEEEFKKRIKKVDNKKSIFRSVDEGIEMVKNGGYAYHTEVNSANSRISKTFDQRELCDLDSLPSMEKTVLYTAVQKNSPYKEFFTWSFMQLWERGFKSCIDRRVLSKASKCEGSSPRALALGGAAPAFIVLAAGYVLATPIMLIERYKRRVGALTSFKKILEDIRSRVIKKGAQ